MRLKSFCHGTPDLSEILLPVLGEKGSERRLLGERSALVVVLLERIDFPLGNVSLAKRTERTDEAYTSTIQSQYIRI